MYRPAGVRPMRLPRPVYASLLGAQLLVLTARRRRVKAVPRSNRRVFCPCATPDALSPSFFFLPNFAKDLEGTKGVGKLFPQSIARTSLISSDDYLLVLFRRMEPTVDSPKASRSTRCPSGPSTPTNSDLDPLLASLRDTYITRNVLAGRHPPLWPSQQRAQAAHAQAAHETCISGNPRLACINRHSNSQTSSLFRVYSLLNSLAGRGRQASN
jgi:hypothetical protein